ncbi:aminoglycoside phosphotransferase family protein [Paenibacillus kobensis]|uniref:aminoglycoside phosphotransferase family protein n=1 Tax=Paenibacillus kobensis TaxID=59841 RepID=UPI000FD8DC51|nr:aminoglycoside phosphotransferase family protein [Paenibacillus kobensis]
MTLAENWEYDWLLNESPLLRECVLIEPIYKGYSSDLKFWLKHQDGTVYVLRTYSLEQEAAKRREFNVLAMMEAQGVACSRPVEIGELPERQLGYMVVSCVDGNDAADELPLLSEREQYEAGVQAGLELRRMHQVQCPDSSVADWESRMLAKHRRYREDYAACGAAIEGDDKLFAFIDHHLPLMKDRPNRFQHDDFHVSNLIMKDGKLSGVIDFNRYDWGDPVHDFLKTGMFSAEISIPFSVGIMDAYHEQSEPDELFWQLFSLYSAMNLVASVVWILKVKPEELGIMMDKVRKVMGDHDNFDSVVPNWYRNYKRG